MSINRDNDNGCEKQTASFIYLRGNASVTIRTALQFSKDHDDYPRLTCRKVNAGYQVSSHND